MGPFKMIPIQSHTAVVDDEGIANTISNDYISPVQDEPPNSPKAMMNKVKTMNFNRSDESLKMNKNTS